eukprot:COSAG02_NODE_494_length_21161_cov_48.367534_6_plen_439_part_00
MADCRLAVAVPGRSALRLRLPAGAALHQVFESLAQEIGQSLEDVAKYYQLQACASEPPHRSRLLTAAADGSRTLSECDLTPQSALVLKPIAGSAASSPRDGASSSSELTRASSADAAAAVAEADRKAMELEKVEMFCAFTGADRRTAAKILARVDWVLENATNHFFEAGVEGVDGVEGEIPDAGDVDQGDSARSAQDRDRRSETVEDSKSGPVGMYVNSQSDSSGGAVPEQATSWGAQFTQPLSPSEAGPESEQRLSEGITPPSGRDAWRAHDDQAKHLLYDWLVVGGLQAFADSWVEAGLDALQDFRDFWLDCPAHGSEQWALLPEPRPKLFEVARARRLLAVIDAAAGVQRTAAPVPPAAPLQSDGAGAEDAGSGVRAGSISDWLSEAKLSEYEALLVDEGGLALADIPHVSQEELLVIGMEKEFHRKRFLRMARR